MSRPFCMYLLIENINKYNEIYRNFEFDKKCRMSGNSSECKAGTGISETF